MNIKDSFRNWLSEAKEVKEFYSGEHTHRSRLLLKSGNSSTLPYDRIGVDRFVSRIVPQILSDSAELKSMYSFISDWTKDAVLYGSSTLIISNDGAVRVSNPFTSFCFQDAFGQSYYFQFKEDEVVAFTSFENGHNHVYYKTTEGFMPTGAVAYSIFYKADSKHASGSSRITKDQRALTDRAIAIEQRADENSDYSVHEQKILNGVYEGFAEEVGEDVQALISGASKILALPRDPDTGEKISVESWGGTSNSGYNIDREAIAKIKAAGYDLAPSELGVVMANPSSADALYAEKEDLVLAIADFEKRIHNTVLDALKSLAYLYDTKVDLSWAEPATPSKAAQADAALKWFSMMPALAHNREALLWAGLPQAVVEEMFKDNELFNTVELKNEIMLEVEENE